MVRTDPAFDLQIRKVRNVAKSTKGKSKAAQEPVTVDETAQAASGAGVEDVTQPIVEDAEIVSDEALVTLEDDASEIDTETPDAEFAEESEASEPAQQEPAVVRETVVEQQSVFLPLLFGGFVAAGIGALGSAYVYQDGSPFGTAKTDAINFESAIKLQEGRIDDLTKQLNAQPVLDTAPYDAAVDAVSDVQAQIGAVVESVDGIETRITELEAVPREDGSGISAAMENELKDLRAALDVQKGELAKMLEDAQSKKQSAEETARQTVARTAMTRILVALESGAPFEDALAEVEANTDTLISNALAQTAAEGVPTLATLSETYPDAARAALAAVRSEDTGSGVASFFAKQLGARSVAPREGDDPDAILSRVGGALDAGRISDALSEADALPDGAKAPLADWIAQATLRLTTAREAETLANSLNSQ